MLTAFRLTERQTAFRRHGVCQESRLFADWNQSPIHSPNSDRLFGYQYCPL